MPILRNSRRPTGIRALPWTARIGLLGLLAGATYGLFLWVTITLPRSEDREPLRIYAAPFLLTPGLDLHQIRLIDRLKELGYRQVSHAPREPGEYRLTANDLELYLHPMVDPHRPAFLVRLTLEDHRVVRIDPVSDWNQTVSIFLEPQLLSGSLGGSRQVREWVPLEAMPSPLIEAVLATEDQRFYEHAGIDPYAVARAAWANIRSLRVVQGGSTITQQLAKNLYYGQQRTWTRKLQEAAAALVLEAKYGKERLLGTYLNEVYMGQAKSVAIYGIAEAARRYFGKPVQALSVGESALLAGMIKGPNLYSPLSHPQLAKERRDEVLQMLRRQKRLSDSRFRAAKLEPIRPAPLLRTFTSAPYFVDLVLLQIEASLGAPPQPGAKVFTTLDPVLQRIAEEVIRRGLTKLEATYPALHRPEQPLQAALVALDPRSGRIVALVGGRDYRTSQFNRAVQAKRQPGSLFKPFVYLAAFEPGVGALDGLLTPATLIPDRPVRFPAGPTFWAPQNYDRRFRGEVTVRTALEQSLNVPTVHVAHRVGLPRLLRLLKRLGLPVPAEANLSLALGSSEVSLLEMTAAYGVLAQEGLYVSPTSIRAFLNPDGKPLAVHSQEQRQAVAPQTAYLMTSLLKGVLERGTASRAQALGLRSIVAGKTGTTNDYRDAWFVGYTPDLAIGVWVGFDDGAPLNLTGAQIALPIWADFARQVIPHDSSDFSKPIGIVTRTIDPSTGLLATPACPERFEEVFIEGTEPTDYCPLHGGGFWKQLMRILDLDSPAAQEPQQSR